MRFYGRIRQRYEKGFSKEDLERMEKQQNKNYENFKKMLEQKDFPPKDDKMMQIQKSMSKPGLFLDNSQ